MGVPYDNQRLEVVQDLLDLLVRRSGREIHARHGESQAIQAILQEIPTTSDYRDREVRIDSELMIEVLLQQIQIAIMTQE